MVKMNIAEVFQQAADDVLCNTSYPQRPEDWSAFRDAAFDVMAAEGDYALYFHVPFCPHLCRFCEYTRVKSGDESQEARYLDWLERTVADWTPRHPCRQLVGLDIGGGTPTVLGAANFRRLLALAGTVPSASRVEDFRSSIEFSAGTLDEEKIAAIGAAGFTRVSTGLQLVDAAFLRDMDRAPSGLCALKAAFAALRTSGVRRINVDVMYGFAGRGAAAYGPTLEAIRELMPDEVTLYEVRYNMNGMSSVGVTRQKNFDLYAYLYDRLGELGYRGRFGVNAFSRHGESGVSSYIGHRMLDGAAYKGFGISAQSMSRRGLSYEALKGFSGVRLPSLDALGAGDVYRLPGEELAAKYVAVALYGGQFRLSVLSTFLGRDAREAFADELDFLVSKGQLDCDSFGLCTLTREGARNYGGVAALFRSKYNRWQ